MSGLENALFARLQMAMSLGFHIIFASVGITMPLLMCLAERRWLETKDPDYLALTRAWAKGTAVFFAIGAVSGTVLAFELGLLFPGFMGEAGAVIGLPFSLEGFAFFTEAIFLGIYLYGWDKVTPRLHLAAGFVVAASGAASAIFVTTANAWMNAPVGFRLENGKFVDIEPLKAMLSPFVLHEVPHGLAACYAATAFAVAAIHAYVLLKNPKAAFHVKALKLALTVAIPSALVQPFLGHLAGQNVAVHQPMKLAAIEGHFETESRAPLKLGGIVDYEKETVHGSLEIPGLLSFLATNRFDGEVRGLKEFPKSDWPSPLARYSFQVMLALGVFLVGLSLWAIVAWRRAPSPVFLKAVLASGPLGIVAMEAGWITTEVGRQPWIIYNIRRTVETVTPMPGLAVPFVTFSLIYLGLGVATVLVLWQHVRRSPGLARRNRG